MTLLGRNRQSVTKTFFAFLSLILMPLVDKKSCLKTKLGFQYTQSV